MRTIKNKIDLKKILVIIFLFFLVFNFSVKNEILADTNESFYKTKQSMLLLVNKKFKLLQKEETYVNQITNLNQTEKNIIIDLFNQSINSLNKEKAVLEQVQNSEDLNKSRQDFENILKASYLVICNFKEDESVFLIKNIYILLTKNIQDPTKVFDNKTKNKINDKKTLLDSVLVKFKTINITNDFKIMPTKENLLIFLNQSKEFIKEAKAIIKLISK